MLVDRWAQWLLRDRHGADDAALHHTLEFLAPIRDRVLADARIRPGDVVLDVGCGDGLIAFGALPLVGEDGKVIFADVSEQLLERCREIAGDLGVTDRCEFVPAAAETLEHIAAASVDVVTTRSVLIYVDAKADALASFHRVLKPGGRISLFEPINRRYAALNRDTVFGYDAGPVSEVAAKVRKVFESAAAPDGAMLGFDETDLLYLAEAAGFRDIVVNLELSSAKEPYVTGVSWEGLLRTRPNPNAPTFGAAITAALSVQEAADLEAYLRPLVESSADGRVRNASAYVCARRP